MKRLCHLLPFAVALAPVASFYAQNASEAPPAAGAWAAAAALALGAAAYAAAWLPLRRDAPRAALAAAGFLALFFTYGHALEAVWASGTFSRMRVLNAALGALWAGLFAAWVLWLRRARRGVEPLARCFAVVSLVALLVAAGRAARGASAWLRAERPEAPRAAPAAPRREFLATDSAETPDIYYIILDGYARHDVLARCYGYDNSAFLSFLATNGFYVAERSRSNYNMTHVSLASSLNMDYVPEGPQRWQRCLQWIRNSRAAQFFQSRGYRYVHIETCYAGTEGSDIADIAYGSAPRWLRGEFAQVLLRTTLLRGFVPSVAAAHLFALRTLPMIASIPGPTFTFAHILMPHRPYVFDREGRVRRDVVASLAMDDRTETWRERNLYLDQVVFLNGKVQELVTALLRDSPVRPIIILQADHGTAYSPLGRPRSPARDDPAWQARVWTRFGILNAYCVPDACRRRLDAAISPVNSFRVLIDACFGGQLGRLPDRCFHSGYRTTRPFEDVTGLGLTP